MQALEAARHLDAKIILVGIVIVPPDQSLSVGAVAARALRKQLRKLGKDERIISRPQIIVSYQPWNELSNLLQKEKPDLLCLEWDTHFTAFGMTSNDMFMRPPCDVALLRGKLPDKPKQVIVSVRGGPHAELSLRVGLELRPKELIALHLRRSDDPEAGSDMPFKGLDRVLKQMPDVQKQNIVTDDPVQFILKKARKADVIVLGTAVQPATGSVSLGPFADRILKEAHCAVIAVKSGRSLPQVVFDESAGMQAISLLVDKWFAENTFHADEFKLLDELVELKAPTKPDYQPGFTRIERRRDGGQSDQYDEKGINRDSAVIG